MMVTFCADEFESVCCTKEILLVRIAGSSYTPCPNEPRGSEVISNHPGAHTLVAVSAVIVVGVVVALVVGVGVAVVAASVAVVENSVAVVDVSVAVEVALVVVLVAFSAVVGVGVGVGVGVVVSIVMLVVSVAVALQSGRAHRLALHTQVPVQTRGPEGIWKNRVHR